MIQKNSNQKYAVVVLVQDKKTNLILGVSRKDNFSDWGLPGGKVEFELGEDFLQAAARELYEETGLGILRAVYAFEKMCGDYMTIAYRVKTLGNISTKESGKVDWVTPQQLVQGSFGEYNKALFEKLNILYA